jgi:hypothetical protein
MSKTIRYSVRALSIVISIALVGLLGWYVMMIWPMYNWALTENTNIGVSLLVMINECMDLFVVGAIIYAAFMVPAKTFYFTRPSNV